MADKLVLEYYSMAVPIAAGRRIKMYDSGKIEVIGIGYSFEAEEDVEGKVLKSLKVNSELVDSFVQRLVKARFLELDDSYEDDEYFSEGIEAGISLQCNGYSKSVTFSNAAPDSNELRHVVSDLENLVK